MTTEASGMFAFDGVPPGEYIIAAQRNGYVRQDGGTRMGPTSTPPVSVAPGQAVTGVTIKLVPHGVVTGRVVDEDGEAAARITVQVQRERWVRGQRQFMSISTDTTNDLGEYRVAGLPAGRYFIVADPGRQSGGVGPMTRRPEGAGDTNYATLFYPNAVDPAQATPVEIGSGQETRGVDFRLRKLAMYRIRGRVVDPSGGSSRNLMVVAVPGEAGAGMAARQPAAVRNEDGTFEIRGIAPGVYTVIANRMGREQGRATASHQITVGNRDLEGVVLTLAPPLEITGTVQAEGDTPVNLGSVRVFLEPAAVMPMFGGTSSATLTNGTFKLSGVSPGNYRVRVTSLPEGTYLKSVRQGQQEVLESGLQLSGASMPIEIMLGAKAPAVTGTVLDSSGKPAANIAASLVPDGPKRNRYELYATATTADAGTFTFRNVAPGDYKIFLLAESEVEGLQNPSFLGQIEARGTSVRLSEGKTENLQLSVK